MHQTLSKYINIRFEEMKQCSWSEEAVTMTGDELFECEKLKLLFKDQMLDTTLYYPIEINSAILPFEIQKNSELIGLGYMDEEKQYLILLRYKDEELINLM